MRGLEDVGFGEVTGWAVMCPIACNECAAMFNLRRRLVWQLVIRQGSLRQREKKKKARFCHIWRTSHWIGRAKSGGNRWDSLDVHNCITGERGLLGEGQAGWRCRQWTLGTLTLDSFVYSELTDHSVGKRENANSRVYSERSSNREVHGWCGGGGCCR